MPGCTFLLSPANSGGVRAGLLRNPKASFDTAVRLREGTASLGEVYSFVSGLYFRGKLTYAQRFGWPLVIVPGLGLVSPDLLISPEWLSAVAAVDVDAANQSFREPLVRDARLLIRETCPVVLLGSIATDKYVDPLLEVLGSNLLFPSAFVGRGDMSRGGLLLRHAASGEELTYATVEGAVRRGSRPARLKPLKSK